MIADDIIRKAYPAPAKTGKQQGNRGQFRPGVRGSPKGRHQGSRHKATMAALALLGNDLEGTTGKLVEKAKAGEPWAIKLVMDKLVPNAKDAPVTFKAPRLRAAGDLQAALSAILRAVSRGKITPDEAHRPSPLS
jgi:hypothetical protein